MTTSSNDAAEVAGAAVTRMPGQMMTQPLLISALLTHAARHSGRNEIVSRRVEGDTHRYTYRDCERRSRQLASALEGLGVRPGDRVATLAWNGYRHMELYYGVSGMGAVVHTINPRLHVDQLAWIVNHAQDVALAFDLTFLPLVDAIASRCPSVKHWILLADEGFEPAPAAAGTTRVPLVNYESLVAGGNEAYAWPTFDENTASGMCYTSGTTGNPRGVLYSHRSTVLHAYGAAMPDAMGVGSRDCICPIVPMFHVNAWGLPFSMTMVGAKIVYPGPHLDGASVYELFESEKVTFSAAVPTVWHGVINHMLANGLRFSTFRRTVIGGSACPPAMMRTLRERFGVNAIHAWGMTETSPLGTLSHLQSHHLALPAEEQERLLNTQGHAIHDIDIKIVDDDGNDLPWDGETSGHLLVRGNWVVRRYFGEDADATQRDAHGVEWFQTGDVATISPDGYLSLTDRTKDVIKSGGEWISSIQLENIAVEHPKVAQAAVIAMPHPKWDERPLLVIVPKPGGTVTRDEILSFYAGRIAKWWTPDDVVIADAMPIGATGKILKRTLREQFRDHRWSAPEPTPPSKGT